MPGTKAFGLALVAVAIAAALAAPVVAPHDLEKRFPGLLNAPPTRPHIISHGTWRPPFIYRWRLVNQLEQTYEEDRSAPVPLVWFTSGTLVQSSNETAVPLLLLGADSYGRDVFSRLLFGARMSLGLAAVASLGALLLGVAVGAAAGYTGGATDDG